MKWVEFHKNAFAVRELTYVYVNSRRESTFFDLKEPQHCYDLSYGWEATASTINNYYSFGMAMPGRNYNLDEYRFGFQGQEMDNEIYGDGNATTAMFWEYDTRLGRRWNRDPITYPWHSPYTVFNDNPILFADPFGLFGTRKEARQYRRENNVRGRIRRNRDEGYYEINDRRNNRSYHRPNEAPLENTIGYNSETGVQTSYAAFEHNSIFGSFGRDPNPYSSGVMRTSWENNKNNPVRDMNMIHVAEHELPKTDWMRGVNRAFGTMLNVGVATPLAMEFAVPIIVESGIESSVLIKDLAWQYLVYLEEYNAFFSSASELYAYTGAFLRHTTAGQVILAIIISQIPEGGCLHGTPSNGYIENLIKYIQELLQTPEGQEWVKNKMEKDKALYQYLK